MKKYPIAILFFTFFPCIGDANDYTGSTIHIKHVEQVCCGSFLTLNNKLITSSCEEYKDSLVVPVNLDDFPVLQSLQINDIISIEYELTNECEALCDNTICNRFNGIPIKVLNIN